MIIGVPTIALVYDTKKLRKAAEELNRYLKYALS